MRFERPGLRFATQVPLGIMKASRIRRLVWLFAATAFCSFSGGLASELNKDNASQRPVLLAVGTQEFKEKQGFERKPKDIINTLKENEVTSFRTLLDGLQQAFELDKVLKNNGPYTLFAPSDKAFKKMPDEDVQTLFANRPKLKQVLSYQIVEGQLNSRALRTMKSTRTLEGHEINFSTKNGDLYVDKSLVLTTDIPCTNGVIHVLEEVVMPPLSK